ncbi:MAG: alkaline phosphatase [Pirellulales bacterium]|nr:alkaline phosphatase [Pirellulales bacterium]
MKTRKVRFLLLAAVVLFSFAASAWAAKNVVIMISDGAGFNVWAAADMYEGRLGRQVYDQPGWVKLGCTTFPLTRARGGNLIEGQEPQLVYSPEKAWDAAPRSEKPGDFAGYYYLKSTATDSAASGTALATGRKTYNGAINWSNDDRPMRGQTIAEIAKRKGKSVGVITSVPWSHATPAALGGAHNWHRNHYVEIAKEMLDAGHLDVIMGAGHPDFDNDGAPLPEKEKRDYNFVGGEETWKSLKEGKMPWKLVESKADFEALTAGPTPDKVLGTARVAATLQEKRGSGRAAIDYKKTPDADPPDVPFTAGVPTLSTMTKAALNCLDDNPQGFFLAIEGGAVDWACHANQPRRMIEEQADFIRSVEAVVQWIESHGGWDETLLILTADHDCGLIWGPDSKTVAFDPIQDRGPGKLPAMVYHSGGHSNSLVPLLSRGPGSDRFAELVKGLDRRAANVWAFSGRYVDNTDVFKVMKSEVVEAGQ